MERTADVTGFALVVQAGRNRDRVRIRFDHRVQSRVQLLNPIEITLDEIFCGELASRHCRLQLRNRRLNKRKIASGKRTVFE